MAQRKLTPKQTKKMIEKPRLSVCDIVHDGAADIIAKMQSLLPINMELYSDLYMECLNSFQDLFGTCYIAEKEIEDTIGIDQNLLENFDVTAKTYSKIAMAQIDMASNIQKAFLQSSISAVKTSDEYIRLMLDSYSRMVSNSLNFPFNKT
ncbi:MAG: hypothetical protein ACREA3_07350 [Nitrosotalea sp.]